MLLLLQLLQLLLLLLLLVHEGNGYITCCSRSLQGSMDQRRPDDGAWPRRHRATSSSGSSGRDGILHGWHAVVFNNLLHQHAVTGTQTSCCHTTTSWTPPTPASTTTHAATKRTALGRLPREHGVLPACRGEKERANVK